MVQGKYFCLYWENDNLIENKIYKCWIWVNDNDAQRILVFLELFYKLKIYQNRSLVPSLWKKTFENKHQNKPRKKPWSRAVLLLSLVWLSPSGHVGLYSSLTSSKRPYLGGHPLPPLSDPLCQVTCSLTLIALCWHVKLFIFIPVYWFTVSSQ